MWRGEPHLPQFSHKDAPVEAWKEPLQAIKDGAQVQISPLKGLGFWHLMQGLQKPVCPLAHHSFSMITS